jgi:hypothetical protein
MWYILNVTPFTPAILPTHISHMAEAWGHFTHTITAVRITASSFRWHCPIAYLSLKCYINLQAQPYRSNIILDFYSARLHVWAVYIRHHQVGTGSQKISSSSSSSSGSSSSIVVGVIIIIIITIIVIYYSKNRITHMHTETRRHIKTKRNKYVWRKTTVTSINC